MTAFDRLQHLESENARLEQDYAHEKAGRHSAIAERDAVQREVERLRSQNSLLTVAVELAAAMLEHVATQQAPAGDPSKG